MRKVYAEAIAAKRRQMLLGGAILIAAIAISGWTAVVRLDTLFKNIGNFFNYFIRLFIFDGGPQSGSPAWTDFGEWFWGRGRGHVSLFTRQQLMTPRKREVRTEPVPRVGRVPAAAPSKCLLTPPHPPS